jgi:hypothetical protein
MDGVIIRGKNQPPKRGTLTNLEDMGKLPKDRRDWFEMFGNQWGTRNHGALPMDAEEKQALAKALNPFADRAAA